MPDTLTVGQGALLGLYAQTALHPGTGTALGTVDLPVQRERHTHWPTVASSALKGVLRDACRSRIANRPDLDNLDRFDDTAERRAARQGPAWQRADATVELTTLFGPPTTGAGEFSGALSITDARLLAFPVRSLRGVFAWVSCAAVLERLLRDADLAGLPVPVVPSGVDSNKILVPVDCPCTIGGKNVLLEEFEFEKADGDPSQVAGWISEYLLPTVPAFAPTKARFLRQLVLLSDDDFTHFVRHATEVTARVGLNPDTKTVKEGALFYQEFLPPETLLYSVVLASPARARSAQLDAAGVLGKLHNLIPAVVQVGGDETTGKGYCATRLEMRGRA